MQPSFLDRNVYQKQRNAYMKIKIENHQTLAVMFEVYADSLSSAIVKLVKNNPNVDLSNANLSNATLNLVDLSGVNLTNVSLRNSILSGVDLSSTNLYGADFSNATLSDVDLSNANLRAANLSNISLSKVELNNTNLSHVSFESVDLSTADLSGINLSNANLTDTNLRRANLSNADLSGAYMRRTNLLHANLNNANLTDVCLWGCVGNMLQVKSAQIHKYPMTWTHDRLQIECRNYPIEQWLRPYDVRTRNVAIPFADNNLLQEHRLLIRAVIKASPAIPTTPNKSGR